MCKQQQITAKLLYRILEIIHSQLRISKVKIHEVVEAPSYIDVQENSIYMFITIYTKYLLYEELSPGKDRTIKGSKLCSL